MLKLSTLTLPTSARLHQQVHPGIASLKSSSSPIPPASPLSTGPSGTPTTKSAKSSPGMTGNPLLPVSSSPSSSAVDGLKVSAPPTTTTTTTTDADPARLALPPSTSGTAKPRSARPAKARSPSPSPPPPAPPPPLQTIRLDIRLGGPDNYEVNIASQARDTGQRAPTPVRTKPPEESSESEDAGATSEGAKKKQKKKKKSAASEYYDVNDPFIDDSELAIDERTWFAQTKQQGFYVSSGEVALLKDKAPKKPKSKKAAAQISGAGSGPSTKASTTSKAKHDVGGTREKPIPIGEDGDGTEGLSVSAVKGGRGIDDGGGEEGEDSGRGASVKTEDGDHEGGAGQKRKRYITIVEGGKKRKIVDVNTFHPEIQAEIERLKEVIAKEDWSQKGKFPPSIKPPLVRLALLAVKLDEYDDHFFSLMPTLFPYNKFTMSKLIKRTVFQDHLKFLQARQDALLEELAEQARAGFAKAEEEWEKSVQAWDKRQEKARLEAAAGEAGGSGSGPASAAPTRHPTEEMEVDGEEGKSKEDKEGAAGGGGPGGGAGGAAKDSHPPAKKYRMTESLKTIVWQLVMLSNECCRLENEKNALEGSVIQVSEQGSRKVLYQKIVAAFPEGWMSSGQISRDVSSMKKKLEKEAMEND
ncbi:hypothetical protein AX17_002756 [Amanita inopinata Kibby_2008]|nr:hypothetical protein AX17_002756 [Amanita inopinata Kibby_2008]